MLQLIFALFTDFNGNQVGFFFLSNSNVPYLFYLKSHLRNLESKLQAVSYIMLMNQIEPIVE